MERQCQRNGTMNSVMKQCQWKKRPSKDRVKVRVYDNAQLKSRSSHVPNLIQLSSTMEQT